MASEGAHPAVVWGAIIGAEAPDIDFVIRYFRGTVGYLKDHRGPTHGFAVLPVQAVLIAAGLELIFPTAPFWLVFWFALSGLLSHVLLDFTNDYGTQGLWPFSRKRFALDLLPIIDFRLLGIIGLGWLLIWVLPLPQTWVFAGVWAAVAAYILARKSQHEKAKTVVVAHLDMSLECDEVAGCGNGWDYERVTIHPTLFSWNAWRYVVQQPGEYWTGLVWVREGRVSEPEKASNVYDQIVLASMKSSVVTAFASWVRRPRVQVACQNGLYEVRWSDMRYEADGFSPFVAYAWLDQQLTLVDEGLQKRGRIDRPMLWRRVRREFGLLDP